MKTNKRCKLQANELQDEGKRKFVVQSLVVSDILTSKGFAVNVLNVTAFFSIIPKFFQAMKKKNERFQTKEKGRPM